MNFPLLMILTGIFAFAVEPAPPELITELKGASLQGVQVGDRLELLVRLPGVESLAEPLTATLPPGALPLRDLGWEARVMPREKQAPEGELRIRVYPLAPGSLELPPLMVADASGKTLGRTQPIQVPVRSSIERKEPAPGESPPAAPEAAPALPPVSLEKPFVVKWGAALLGALLALAVVSVVFVVARARRRRPPVELFSEVPSSNDSARTAEALAIDSLKKLEAMKWIDAREYRKHSFAASRILRRYLGARYSFDAEESTTAEILAALSASAPLSSDLRGERVAHLKSLLEEMDRVKYAGGEPSEDLIRALGPRIRNWIRPSEPLKTGGPK